MTAIDRTLPNWGTIHTRPLGRRWELLDNTHNLVGRWHRDEGSVVLKRFSSRPDYRRSLQILEAVNHLPIFPRLLGTARINRRPGLVFEDLSAAEWVVAQMMEGKEFLHRASPQDRDRIASGLVTRLGLLHSYGIVPNGMEFVDQFMIHRTSGEVHWLDSEAYCLPGERPVFARDPLADPYFLTELGYPPGAPPVPMYEKIGENRWEIPGQGHYVVTLGDVLGPRSMQLAGSHHVEFIDFDPEQIEIVNDHRPSIRDRSGSLRTTLGKWQETHRQADYVEAYFPVTGTERHWDGPRGFFYDALVNKMRCGGIAYLVSENVDFTTLWADLVQRDPRFAMLRIGYGRIPIRGGYAWKRDAWANDSSFLFFRKLADV